jgi:hypothetical protein
VLPLWFNSSFLSLVIINGKDDGGSCVCADLDRVAVWATSNDAEARAVGARARKFSETVLGKPMVSLETRGEIGNPR